jgi:DsbC/DsbD-like thiol-disulfide interchange protein
MKLVAAILVLLAAPLASSAASTDDLVQAELVAGTSAVEAGKPFEVGLRLHIADGWHVYWTNPGDAGAATTFKLSLPPGYTVGAVEYPVPEKLPQPGGLVVYAYEKELLLTATITPPADLGQATVVPIFADAGWCVCDPEQCVLGKKSLQLNLQVGHGSPANGELLAAWNSRLPQPPDAAFTRWGFNGSGNADELYETVVMFWRADPPADLQWLPGSIADLTFKSANLKTEGRTTQLHLVYDRIQGIPLTSSTISGVLAYHKKQVEPAGGVGVTFDIQRPGN